MNPHRASTHRQARAKQQQQAKHIRIGLSLTSEGRLDDVVLVHTTHQIGDHARRGLHGGHVVELGVLDVTAQREADAELINCESCPRRGCARERLDPPDAQDGVRGGRRGGVRGRMKGHSGWWARGWARGRREGTGAEGNKKDWERGCAQVGTPQFWGRCGAQRRGAHHSHRASHRFERLSAHRAMTSQRGCRLWIQRWWAAAAARFV